MTFPLLTLAIFLPFILSLPLFVFNKEKHFLIKCYAFAISLITFALTLSLYLKFNPSQGFQFQHISLQHWLGSGIDVKYSVALDGNSILLFLFSAFVFPMSILASWKSIATNSRSFYFFLLTLETCILGIFAATDLFLFYTFWEAMLIPMVFLIGMWGGSNRTKASTTFLIYMLSASLFMLVGIIYLGFLGMESTYGIFTTDYQKLVTLTIPIYIQNILFWLFALAFLAKAPLFPFHSWLVDVYTESPITAILTGILLKMATYGLIRFDIMLFPSAAATFSPLLSILAVISILYGALLAFIQTDIRRVIAYSSLSHLGFLILGIFAFTEEALQGSMIQMINHGLSTGLIFVLIGFLYERKQSTALSDFGGLKRTMPIATLLFTVAMLSSIGLPGLNGFVGEFLILIGSFKSVVLKSGIYSIFAAIGVVLSAVYMLPLFQKIFLGEITSEANRSLPDLTVREILIASTFVLFIIWIGVSPNTFLELSGESSRLVIARIQESFQTIAPLTAK